MVNPQRLELVLAVEVEQQPGRVDGLAADFPLLAEVELLEPLLDFLLGSLAAAGREAVTVAIGCTGGRHRSVALVEHLGAVLHAQGYTPEVHHRDIDKE